MEMAFLTVSIAELFDIFQSHAYEKLFTTRLKKKKNPTQTVAELPASDHPVVSKAHTVELIMMDVSRTFPSLCIFQEVLVQFILIRLPLVAIGFQIKLSRSKGSPEFIIFVLG